MSEHKSHPDIVKRLKRAHGHLARVTAMIESEETCLDIAQQLQAVISALNSAKKVLVQDHIENCLTAAIEKSSATNTKAKLDEFREIAKYL